MSSDPSFDFSFEENAPGLIPPPPPSPWKKRARIAIIALAALVVILLLVQVGSTVMSTTGIGGGSGVVTGQVLTDSGQPVEAELIIEFTEVSVFAGSDGRFELREVPSGPQILLVGYQGMGVEYPILVQSDQTTDVGVVQPATTAEAEVIQPTE
jgi:hypothetical protein